MDWVPDPEHSERYSEENLLSSLEEETQPAYNYPEFYATIRRAMGISDEQRASGNTRLVEKFIESNTYNQISAEEIQQLNKRLSVPLTWSRRRHPISIYYNLYAYQMNYICPRLSSIFLGGVQFPRHSSTATLIVQPVHISLVTKRALTFAL